MSQTFWVWLLNEDRYDRLPAGVIQGYEAAFKQALRTVIQRTEDPNLRATFQGMLDCPIRTASGCRSFTDYILGALIKNGIQNQYDMEGALQYVVEKMLMPSTDTGEPRGTVFGGFDPSRPYEPATNPLQARFMKFLTFSTRAIRMGALSACGKSKPGQQGRFPLGLDGARKAIPAKVCLPNNSQPDHRWKAISVKLLLIWCRICAEREPAYGLPLVAIFQAMLAGQRTAALRQNFGDRAARTARQVVIQTVEDYARQTENYALLRLLQRFQAGEPASAPRQPPKPAAPKLEPGKEKDFASIISVMDRLGGRPVGSADFGRFRRRWLEYPPRDPASGYRNRLEETLAKMAEEQVLKATRTANGATVYSPGQNYQQYRHPALVRQEA